jgi:predicted Zn finger-like uncharacterized protein
MILSCPECQTKYRLDPALLGSGGRMVGCTVCKNRWFQPQTEESAAPRAEAAPVSAPVPAPAPEPAAEPVPEQAPPPVPLPHTFEQVLKETAAAVAPAPKIPEAVRPLAEITPAAPVYKLMGMSPLQFGALTFLACCFVTLSTLFLVRGPLVRALPSTSAFYKALGFSILAPGEGLRLEGIAAENRVDKDSRVLAVTGKLSNMSAEPQPWPNLVLTLKSAYGAVLKEWHIPAKEAKPLASGESAPVNLEFKDAPEGGADIDLKVVE